MVKWHDLRLPIMMSWVQIPAPTLKLLSSSWVVVSYLLALNHRCSFVRVARDWLCQLGVNTPGRRSAEFSSGMILTYIHTNGVMGLNQIILVHLWRNVMNLVANRYISLSSQVMVTQSRHVIQQKMFFMIFVVALC